MNDKEFKKRLRLTKFVVEASSYEMQTLWERFCKDTIYKTPMSTHTWEQLNPGCSETIGQLDGRPVCLSLFWNKIDGVMIMFYDVTSQVADYVMVEKWLDKNCNPKYDRGRQARCDAQNFHLALHYIDNKNKSKHDTAASVQRDQEGAAGGDS